MHFSYNTFIKTYSDKSSIPNAGNGLFAGENISPFTWIGFYPGKQTNVNDIKVHHMHIMGCVDEHKVIEANPNIKKGVHLVNEASKKHVANVWYVKFKDGNCLYFAATDI